MLDESRERFRKSYAAGGVAYQRVRDDRRTYIAKVVVILLGSLLFESLAHYTTWSLVPRIVVSAAAFVCSVPCKPSVQPKTPERWLIVGRKIAITRSNHDRKSPDSRCAQSPVFVSWELLMFPGPYTRCFRRLAHPVPTRPYSMQ
jgi:hypothetical protein